MSSALAYLDIDATIDQIASGRLMHQIASEHGVTKGAIRKRLVNHPRYLEAIKDQAEALVDTATAEVMEVDADQVLIARARARVDAAHKWAAARDPANWGAKQQVTINHGVSVDDALDGLAHKLLDRMRVVEAESVVIEQQIAPESGLSTDSMHSVDDEPS